MTDKPSIGELFLTESIATFRSQKDLAERALAQVTDADLHVALDVNTNPIAVIMKHLAGNLLSRWTDFLSSDGEKSWRHRDRRIAVSVVLTDHLSRWASYHWWSV